MLAGFVGAMLGSKSALFLANLIGLPGIVQMIAMFGGGMAGGRIAHSIINPAPQQHAHQHAPQPERAM